VHNFLVGNQGTVVHNSCLAGGPCGWLWDVTHKYGNKWESALEHITKRHTGAGSGSTKSIFNSVFDDNPQGLQNMLTETVQDWAKYKKGEGTLIDFIEMPNGDLRFLVDFSSRKSEFGIGTSDFFGKASNGDPINTIRVTLTSDLKVYNAFPSKSLNGPI